MLIQQFACQKKKRKQSSLELPEWASGLALAGGFSVVLLGKGMLDSLRGAPESQCSSLGRCDPTAAVGGRKLCPVAPAPLQRGTFELFLPAHSKWILPPAALAGHFSLVTAITSTAPAPASPSNPAWPLLSSNL